MVAVSKLNTYVYTSQNMYRSVYWKPENTEEKNSKTQRNGETYYVHGLGDLT